MTIEKALIRGINRLKRMESKNLDAELLLSFVLKKTRSYLYIWPKRKISGQKVKVYQQLVTRRLKEEPVAYLIGNKEFYGLDFYVNKNVLIPRPETECLVEEILKYLRIANRESRIAIADIGTGSGCLAITLKKYLPKAKIFASDISKKALVVANKNAKKHTAKIFFKQGNLLEPFKKTKLDLIVANLPYLKPLNKYLKKYPGLKYEPPIALNAGSQGLDLYQEFFVQLKKYQPRTKVFIEIDPSQTKAIKKIILKNLPRARIEIKKDLAGKNRIVIIN